MKSYLLVMVALVGISALYGAAPVRGHQRSRSLSPRSVAALKVSFMTEPTAGFKPIEEQPGGENALNELNAAGYVQAPRSKRGDDLDPAGKGKRGGKSCAQDCSCQGCVQAACLGFTLFGPFLIQLGVI